VPIDPELAIGADLGAQTFAWTSSDVLLYHLALGAGAEPTDPKELRYAYERDLRVLPTFATVAQNLHRVEAPAVEMPGIDVDLAQVVHGTQAVTVHGPIPVEGEGVARARIVDVQDKGRAAVIVSETTVHDVEEAPLWTARSSIFVRGEGGFGGRRGNADRVELPDREPDATIDTPTLPQQALLYRLCGDRNPLHADPEFARAAGFDVPILHRLCMYGIVAKAVTDALLAADVTRVRSFSARFAGIVLPGETLRTQVWRDGPRLLLGTSSLERDAPALSDAVLTTV
jgi:acyl dehydratase